MKLFKKKWDTLIKDTVQTAKTEATKEINIVGVLAGLACIIFLIIDNNAKQPININIYTYKEV